MTRALVLWIIGLKLPDAAVTYVDCGLLGRPEFNPALVLLSENLGGYWVAFPYLLLFGLAGVLFLWYKENGTNIVMVFVSAFFGVLIFITCLWGPVSHVLSWYTTNGVFIQMAYLLTIGVSFGVFMLEEDKS